MSWGLLLEHSDLTDAQWRILDPLIPEPQRRVDGRGRPWRGRRDVLNGILWILHTGAAWADLPDRYPPYQTCHRRFQHWVQAGVLLAILEALGEDAGLGAGRMSRRPSPEIALAS